MFRRRWVLWIAFVCVHVGIAGFGLIHPGAWPFSDVIYAYKPWMSELFRDGAWQGLSVDGVYPVLAPVPMVLAAVLAPVSGYLLAWLFVSMAANAIGFAVLLGRGDDVGRFRASWFWLIFLTLLGPVSLGRIDGITVPVAIVGGLLLGARPALAGAILAVGAWIKIWPVAIAAAAFVALRGRWRIAAGAAGVTLGILIVAAVSGSLTHTLSFVAGQTGRGLQFEAPVALPLVWAAAVGTPGVEVAFDDGISTYQIEGAAADLVSAWMTPVLILALAFVLVLGARAKRVHALWSDLFPVLALALVLVLIVFNKVGSPQFTLWLIAPIALALSARGFRRFAVFGWVAAFLTLIVYPLVYDSLLALDTVGLVAQTLRVLWLCACLVVAGVVLWRMGTRTVVTV